MALTASGFRNDLVSSKSGGKGKPCGESHIPKQHECNNGKAPAQSEKQPRQTAAQVRAMKQKQQELRAQIAVTAVYMGISLAGLKAMQNSKEAYELKFGGDEAFTPLSAPIGSMPKKMVYGEAMGDPSAFGAVVSGKVVGKNGTFDVVIKEPNKGGGGGAAVTGQLKGMGFKKQALENVRTQQNFITSQEGKAAKLAGDLGFGPKVLYADQDKLIMEPAKGQALLRQTGIFAGGKAKDVGGNLSVGQKKSLIGGMAKMHAAGMAHNDLHAGNIFVSDSGSSSFIDFGTASKGGGAVAAEWARMQGKPRYGLSEQGGMGFNLRTVTPTQSRQTETKIKQIIGKRIGRLTDADVTRAIKKNPTLDKQLQDAVNEYYTSIMEPPKISKTDSMDLTPATFRSIKKDEDEPVTGVSEGFAAAMLENGMDLGRFSGNVKGLIGMAEQYGATQESASEERRQVHKQESTERLALKKGETQEKEQKAAFAEQKAAHEKYMAYKQMRAEEHREHVLKSELIGIGKSTGNSIFGGRKNNSKEDSMDLTPLSLKTDACWKGYVQAGTKRKGNRTVPNCVPAGKRKAKIKKAGLDNEDGLTSAKRSVWADGFEPKKTKARR